MDRAGSSLRHCSASWQRGKPRLQLAKARGGQHGRSLGNHARGPAGTQGRTLQRFGKVAPHRARGNGHPQTGPPEAEGGCLEGDGAGHREVAGAHQPPADLDPHHHPTHTAGSSKNPLRTTHHLDLVPAEGQVQAVAAAGGHPRAVPEAAVAPSALMVGEEEAAVGEVGVHQKASQQAPVGRRGLPEGPSQQAARAASKGRLVQAEAEVPSDDTPLKNSNEYAHSNSCHSIRHFNVWPYWVFAECACV